MRVSDLAGPFLLYVHSLGNYVAAMVLGGAVGFERQWRQRTAGLRTNVLVTLGAAAFTDLGGRVFGPEGMTRIIAYVVSGIGFLGAGVIIKDGANITGLNTAATLWCSAAVGALSGAGLAPEAASFATLVIAGNTLLRPVSNWIDRRPVRSHSAEAEYHLHLTCVPKDVARVRDLLDGVLEHAQYHPRSVRLLMETSGQIELDVLLAGTTAVEAELDAVTASLEASPRVLSATWSMSSTS